MEHASFVQPAIRRLLEDTGLVGSQFRCVAVANGPGSYTGLRVGLAAAKGLCYAWKIPLSTLSSLGILAMATRDLVQERNIGNMPQDYYLAPMIDARRMEVFFALYRQQGLKEIFPPCAQILESGFLAEWLRENTVFFAGDGALKWQSICQSPNAHFVDTHLTEGAFAHLAMEYSKASRYADLAYAEPFYAKDFYSPIITTK